MNGWPARGLKGFAWLALLALLPWWLGLPLLLAVAAVLALPGERLSPQASTLRLALRWGLPGVLLSALAYWGLNALGLTLTLVAALLGFTLLVGLETWLDRHERHGRQAPAAADDQLPEWPAPSAATAGPPAVFIELAPPQWAPAAALAAAMGGPVRFEPLARGGGRLHLADGRQLDAAADCACMSPDGRWVASQSRRGVMLWDRQRDCLHRLRRWQLCGWHEEQPWLLRHAAALPTPLSRALGEPQPHIRRGGAAS